MIAFATVNSVSTISHERRGLSILAALALLGSALGLAILSVLNPAVALAALVTLVLVSTLALRVDFALLAVVVAAPLEGALAFGSDGTITLSKVTGLMAFGSFLLYALASARPLRFDVTHALVAALMVISLLSALQARDVMSALLVTSRYASFAVIYLIITQFVYRPEVLRRVAWALAGASSVAAAWSIYNYVTEKVLFRATLEFADPNDVAFILATSLPLALWLFSSEHVTIKVVVAAMAGVMLAAILLTFSRGAIVGLAVGMLWWMVVERSSLSLILAGCVVALCLALAVVSSNPDQFDESLNAKSKVAAGNVETRLDAWTAAASLAARYPLGVGPGNFGLHYLEETGRPSGSAGITVVHNTYLDIAAELGVAAAVLFIAYLGVCMRRLGVARRRGFGPPGYAAALRTALVIALAAGVFLSQQYYLPFWLLGALGTALWSEGRVAPTTA